MKRLTDLAARVCVVSRLASRALIVRSSCRAFFHSCCCCCAFSCKASGLTCIPAT